MSKLGSSQLAESKIATSFVLIDHLGVNVTDLARSETWYQEVLGFQILHRWKTTTLVGLGSAKIGLFCRPDSQPIDNLDAVCCMHHLAFLVDGNTLMQTRQQLIDKGIITYDEDNGIGYCVFFLDPD